MNDLSKSIESAKLLALAKTKAFNRSQNTQDSGEVEEIKRKIVKEIIQNPGVFRELMKNMPQSMNNLVQKYGGK
jgi:hypothetical protein